MMNETNTIESTENTETANTESMESTETILEAGASGEADEGDAEGEAIAEDVKKDKGPPAYEAFVAALKSHSEALGLTSKEQKSFFQFTNIATGHKLYVAKGSRGVNRIDTTLPEEQLPGICLKLEKENGRIACHVQPSVEAVQMALDVLSSFGEKLRAPKRAPKAADPAPAA